MHDGAYSCGLDDAGQLHLEQGAVVQVQLMNFQTKYQPQKDGTPVKQYLAVLLNSISGNVDLPGFDMHWAMRGSEPREACNCGLGLKKLSKNANACPAK